MLHALASRMKLPGTDTLFVLLGSIVSGWATFTGLWAFTGSLMAAVLAVVLVQLGMIHVAGKMATELGSRGAFLGCLLAYLGFMSVSVAFGYGFYFDLWSGQLFAERSRSEQASRMIVRFVPFQERYEELAAIVRRAAEYSRRTAQVERRQGGTCGGEAVPGDGPRARLRLREARLFESFAEHFTNRSRRFADLIEEAGRAADSATIGARALERRLVKLHAEASAMAEDSRLADFRRYAAARLEQGRGGFLDPRSKRSFTCPDPELERMLEEAKMITLPKVEQPSVKVFAANRREGQLRAFNVLYGLFLRTVLVPAGQSDADPSLRFDPAYDLGPLVFAVVVDLLVFWLAFQRSRRELHHLARRLAGRPAFGLTSWRRLDRLVAGDGLPESVRLFERALFEDGRHAYFVIPLTDSPESRRARALARALDATGALDVALRYHPVEDLPEWWRLSRAAYLADARQIETRRIPRRVVRGLWLDVLRDAEPEQAAPSPRVVSLRTALGGK